MTKRLDTDVIQGINRQQTVDKEPQTLGGRDFPADVWGERTRPCNSRSDMMFRTVAGLTPIVGSDASFFEATGIPSSR